MNKIDQKSKDYIRTATEYREAVTSEQCDAI